MHQKLKQLIQQADGLANKIAGRMTQSWRMIIAGAVFLCLISIGLMVYAFRPHETRSIKIESESSVEATSTVAGFARALDGVFVEDASSTRLLPFAVMVENSADAWPLSGPAKANVVYEAPVEGGITRFMLIFDSATSTTDQIGPVRSARPYYVDFAEGVGALYAHVGGSPDALAMLKRSTSRVTDLNEFYNGTFFWRSNSRSAPHNTYTNLDRLNRATSRLGAVSVEFELWNYTDEVMDPSLDPEGTISVPYQGIYRTSWTYDTDERTYRRSQNGSIQRDADGSTVDVSNVVIMVTDSQVLDDVGRLKLRTTGMGDALLFTGGVVQHGVWRREEGGHLRFETEDGRDMLFSRGKTWISVLTSEEAFQTVADQYTGQ